MSLEHCNYIEFPRFPFSTNSFNLLLIRPISSLGEKSLVRTCKLFFKLFILRFRLIHISPIFHDVYNRLFRPPPFPAHSQQRVDIPLFYLQSVTCNFTVNTTNIAARFAFVLLTLMYSKLEVYIQHTNFTMRHTFN